MAGSTATVLRPRSCADLAPSSSAWFKHSTSNIMVLGDLRGVLEGRRAVGVQCAGL